MKIGDVVVSRQGPFSGHLCRGSGIYTHAIVVSLDPFAMVSEEGDMLWTQMPMNELVALCQASQSIQEVALARWRRSSTQWERCNEPTEGVSLPNRVDTSRCA